MASFQRIPLSPGLSKSQISLRAEGALFVSKPEIPGMVTPMDAVRLKPGGTAPALAAVATIGAMKWKPDDMVRVPGETVTIVVKTSKPGVMALDLAAVAKTDATE